YTLFQMHIKQQAFIIAGNHEYFLALLYHKTINNKNTLWYYLQRDYFPLYIEFNNKKEDLYPYIDWILQLPIFIEFEKAIAIHAIWDENHHQFLSSHNTVKNMIEFINTNPEYKEPLNKAIMGITIKININNSHKTTFFRYKWWENNQETPISELFTHKTEHFPSNLQNKIDINTLKINTTSRPIFFGHYNLRGYPYLTNPTKCCLDFGGAKGGYLTAYRWDGENILDPNKIIYV
ncbi:MAG: metallophosphoesterase, partial [Bacteroidales bacterium]|nr:metallophosphoesterase [Bacteroidales bacterium]